MVQVIDRCAKGVVLRALQWAVLILVGLAGSVVAETVEERVGAAWETWLRDQADGTQGVLVLMYNGNEVARFEHKLRADQPVDLQSTSKAITAQCVKALVEAGQLQWETRLSDVLQDAGRSGDVTIAQLVTHTSGLRRDKTQGAMDDWRKQAASAWGVASKAALARRPRGKPGSHVYNNENYAILGVVIETVTGQVYEVACKERVLAPLGIASAELSPQTGAFGPWGGWQMAPEEYARFHRASYVGTWPTDAPLADMGHGISYGLGMVSRHGNERSNYWHFGLLCFGRGDADNGGSYTVSWDREWSLFAAWRSCVDWEAMLGLDQAMIKAVFQQAE